MIQATLDYYKDAAIYLHGYDSKAVALMDRFINSHGGQALPDKTPQEMMHLIMNIDHAGFGVLDEELFLISNQGVLYLLPDHIEGEVKKQAEAANSDRAIDLGQLTEKENYYQAYYRLFLGGAICFGMLSLWFTGITQSTSAITCDIITVICLAMTVICYHSYKHSGRVKDEIIRRERQPI